MLELNLLETSTIYPKEKVILKPSEAELFNENKRLQFELDNIKKQLKVQQ